MSNKYKSTNRQSSQEWDKAIVIKSESMQQSTMTTPEKLQKRIPSIF